METRCIIEIFFALQHILYRYTFSSPLGNDLRYISLTVARKDFTRNSVYLHILTESTECVREAARTARPPATSPAPSAALSAPSPGVARGTGRLSPGSGLALSLKRYLTVLFDRKSYNCKYNSRI